MTLKTSKFTIGTPDGEGCANRKEYSTLLLTKLKNAFIDAGNGAWSQVGDIEPLISGYTGTQGVMTLQLKSSVTNKYFRAWALVSNMIWDVITTAGTNTNTSLHIYSGNLFKQNNYQQTDHYRLGGYAELYFAVSDNEIDPDFAKDLHLTFPMFCINNEPNQSVWCSIDGSSDGQFVRNGGTVTVITDGSMFGIIKYSNGHYPAVFYAPDMFITANEDDDYTEGIVSSNGYANNFYFGAVDNTYNNAVAIFKDANGHWDFNGAVQGCDTAKNQLFTSSTCNKMPTGPLCFWMYPYTYEGSDMGLVSDGICIKGWVNTNYLRSAHNTMLAIGQKGLRYANGSWLCMDAGTLICWDGSDSSPFEPVVSG